MKTKSPPIINVIIGIIIAFVLLSSVIFVGNTIYHLKKISNNQPDINKSLSTNPNHEQLLERIVEMYPDQDSIIRTDQGAIIIHRKVYTDIFTNKEEDNNNSIYFMLTLFMDTFFILFILYYLFWIYKTALTGQVFILKNVRRIKNISWLLLGYIIYDLWGYTLIENLYYTKVGYNLNENYNFESPYLKVSLLFLVLVIFGLSELFKIGVDLKEDNDLTV